MAEPEIPFSCHNTRYVEQLLEDYLRDPARVPLTWRRYFEQFEQVVQQDEAVSRKPSFSGRRSWALHAAGNGSGGDVRLRRESQQLQDRVERLIHAYRVRGHLIAQLNPLGPPPAQRPELDPKSYGLGAADLDLEVLTTSTGGPQRQTVRELIDRLHNTYCRFVGAQFMHIDDLEIRNWLQQRMEDSENRWQMSREDQLRILTRLTDAVIFEEFVRKKFLGAKTFSLEGAESLIPLLDLAIEKAASQEIDDIVIGMPHRGRLNVLANIIGKRPLDIFREFEDPRPKLHRGRGDVKYHLGFSGDWLARGGRSVHLSLCFNPSHLEFVNPVALGRMRARQDRRGDAQRRHGMVLLIHGDASFAGEGVVQETLNLSQLPGYATGGTLHVIVNNQIGFTTSPHEARSMTYPSDVARMLQIPIFHVNGEQPEAVARVVELALDFRQKFRRDVVLDMYCYRRWGHNEADEPSFTQPLLYQAIEHRPSVRSAYLEHLMEMGGVTGQEAEQIAEQRHEHLKSEFALAQKKDDGEPARAPTPTGVWEGFRGGIEPDDDHPTTGLPVPRLAELLRKLIEVPQDFRLHPKLQRSVDRRQSMAQGETPLDWSAAEALALASLAVEGYRIRLSGQDSERGTFSQRHSVLHDVKNGDRYSIFSRLAADQGTVEIINSPLSETGVLGFEYGYSLDQPHALVMWEAQFGDFLNAGQVIIDQFLASAEDKWWRLSSLVLLLPHGFEGQGPEHSSARLERFLTMTAEQNLQVANLTTPAQYFHCLRRQVLRRWRKPLVLMTPKSLLRHAGAVSTLEELAQGQFQRVIADADVARPRRVLLCSGKIYYDLLAERQQRKIQDVAIVRVEQFYPLPDEQLRQAIGDISDDTELVWVQEEPLNMGAWQHWRMRFGSLLWDRFPLRVVAREESASPATGSSSAHAHEQQALLQQAFGSLDRH
jgi:2-oxoglutarate dehydrogenase E1 component